jgi:DMSO/TMAO reductase YedYZ molybdopterin-dependent catalytic subunit
MHHERVLAIAVVFALISTFAISMVAVPVSSTTVSVDVEGKSGNVSLDLSELKAMATVAGDSSYQNRFGNWKGIGTYTGVNISDLVELVGGMEPGDTVTVLADDGYNFTFSYDNVYNTWSDPAIQGNMILAYAFNGTEVPTWEDGLRLAFLPEDEAMSNADMENVTALDLQVTSAGSLWISSVDRIVVNSPTWTVGLINGTYTTTYGDQQIRNMTSVTADGGYNKTTGAIIEPDTYTGVNVSYLLQAVGGISAGQSVLVTSSDEYQMTFTYEQVIGNESTWMVLAYEMDGAPLYADTVPRIVFIGPDAPITDGHLWQKMVASMEIVPAVPDYTLQLIGAFTMNMDRQTLESGISCHKAEITDSAGTYTGIPLWRLCGFVDDPESIGAHEYADGLNYTVTVYALDGFNKTFSFETVDRNDTLILANSLDGKSLNLSGMYPPLKLVGNMSNSLKVKNVYKIVLNWQVDIQVASNRTSVKPGEAVTITATISDGAPIPGQNISFFVNNVKIGEDTTDSQGEASIEYSPSSNGTYEVKAVFVYGETENQQTTTVTASTPQEGGGGIGIEVVAGLVIVIAAVVIVAAYILRRKK